MKLEIGLCCNCRLDEESVSQIIDYGVDSGGGVEVALFEVCDPIVKLYLLIK